MLKKWLTNAEKLDENIAVRLKICFTLAVK